MSQATSTASTVTTPKPTKPNPTPIIPTIVKSKSAAESTPTFSELPEPKPTPKPLHPSETSPYSYDIVAKPTVDLLLADLAIWVKNGWLPVGQPFQLEESYFRTETVLENRLCWAVKMPYTTPQVEKQ